MSVLNTDTDGLIDRATQGDMSASHTLLDRHRDRLRRMVDVRIDPRLSARIDPSDVVQEALAEANEKLPDYLSTRPIPFYPWLRQIAWQRLIHLHEFHLRSKRSVAREQSQQVFLSDNSAAQLASQLVDHKATASEAAVREETQNRVRSALGQLTSEQREILVQRYLEQLSAKEIAVVLNISEAAVNMRHMRALERMRALLNAELEGDKQ